MPEGKAGPSPAPHVSMSKCRRQWSATRVIQEIDARHQQGLPINSQAVMDQDSALWAAARRYFGNWRAAVVSCGLKPQRLVQGRHERGYWSREKILTQIREAERQGWRLDSHGMQQRNNRLVAAAVYYFGSWTAALAEAGFDSLKIRRTVRRTPHQVLAAIQDAMRNGEDLRDTAVRQRHRALYGAAQKVFGSWRRARELAEQELLLSWAWRPQR